MTKAVILDSYTTNPGDLNWEPLLKQFDDYEIYERTQPDQVAERIQGAEYVFTNKVDLDRQLIESADKLEYIGVMATGYDVIDLEAAQDYNVTVTNVPSYSTHSVAQLTIAFLLAHTNHVGELNQSIQAGGWVDSPDFSYWQDPITELAGKTFGLIGFGDIAKQVARIVAAFDMEILVTNRSEIEAGDIPAKQVEFDELLEKSDVISIHVPLVEKTRNLFNTSTLRKMKKNAILINTARGPIVNQMDLADALKTEEIAGAGIDVIDQEPMEEGHPLLDAPNVYITPHVGWASTEARRRLIHILADNVATFMSGQPQNTVNKT